ncbi:hypothetical protein H671_4g11915 [Cricetulus griseus]|uniref:Uncharacterized protein n=1 Tax=Cricetulus griseus TaxID=10029 RepID=A0A061IAW0_CRIGR|nr:hypothetical protein H671_4g11915 [Cricetulus griseus]
MTLTPGQCGKTLAGTFGNPRVFNFEPLKIFHNFEIYVEALALFSVIFCGLEAAVKICCGAPWCIFHARHRCVFISNRLPSP